MDYRKMIGKRLKEWRLDDGLTQTQLANKMGVSQAFICKTEQGKASYLLEDLPRLSKSLGPGKPWEIVWSLFD